MRLQASIIAILLSRPELIFESKAETVILGGWIHQLVYPSEEEQLPFKTIDGVKISGKPDKVVRGVVEELKTFHDDDWEVHLKQASIQANIYCCLGGFKRYRVRLFHIPSLKEKNFRFMANYGKALKDIRRAIKIYKQLRKTLGISE